MMYGKKNGKMNMKSPSKSVKKMVPSKGPMAAVAKKAAPKKKAK
jgi:hypothetical protein